MAITIFLFAIICLLVYHHDVIYHTNCIDRPNRYDISVTLVMDEDALPEWDKCKWHKQWKDTYGDMLEVKCIFDYED